MGELIFRSPVHLSEFKLSAAKLTKAFIDSAPAGVYSDPATPCLRLRVRPGKDGAKQRAWILRRTVAGKRYDVGLGNLETVPLARARLAAAELNSLSDDDFIGRLEEKRAGRRKKAEAKPAAAVTFAKACELFAEWNVRMGVWEDWGKTHRVFESSMRLHVLPTLGAMPLTDITPKIVASMAEKIWEHADLVNRCLIYTKQVFDWAKASEFCTGDNPADRTGALKYLLPKRKHVKQHHGALSVAELPEFFAELVREPLTPSRAIFAFSILTATRSLTVRAARWEQFDFRHNVWRIPAEQLKVSENGALIVPLCPRVVEFLKEWGIEKEGFLFSPEKTNAKGAMFSDAVFSNAVKRINEYRLSLRDEDGRPLPKWIDKAESLKRGKEVGITQHGIARATFRTWAQDDSLGNDRRFDARTAELCLHHKVTDAYNGAYERNASMIRRREMMEAWAEYCFSRVPAPHARQSND